MADRVTSCPHCSTSFRITDAQLQTAKGAVRCGSCLQIFRALDHLQPLAPEPSAAVKTSTVEAAVAKETWANEQPLAKAGNEKPAANKTPLAPKAAAGNEPSAQTEAPAKSGYSLSHDQAHKTEIERAIDKSSALLNDASARSAEPAAAPTDSPSDGPDKPAAAQTPPESSPEVTAFTPGTDEDDDMLISDDMDQDTRSQSLHLGELSDSFRSQGRAGNSHKGSLFDREIKIDSDTEDDFSDESWAVDLLQELGHVDDDDTDDGPEPTFSQFNDDFDLEEAEKQHQDRLFADITGDDHLPDDAAAAQAPREQESDVFKSASPTFGRADEPGYGDDSTAEKGNGDDTFYRELEDDFSSSRKEPTFSLIEEESVAGDDDFSAEHHSSEDYSIEDHSTEDYSTEDYLTEDYSTESYLTEDYAARDEFDQDDADDYRSATEPYSTETEPDHALLLEGIARAPVEMEWQQEKSPWPARLLWASLSLVAAVALAAQLAWYKFETYSRIEPWRQGYMTICPLLDCQVPPIADPRRVKAYNLVVRSNPRADNALIIDSILLNTATFDQPFPDFTLTFSNLQGKQLAYRRFTPAEYLGGEMAGARQMPSGQPVHISLEILDPGPDAVNYTAAIPLD